MVTGDNILTTVRMLSGVAQGFDDQLDKAVEKVNLTSKRKIENMKEAGAEFNEGEAGLDITGKDESA